MRRALILLAAICARGSLSLRAHAARGRRPVRVHAGVGANPSLASASSILTSEGLDIAGDGGCLKVILNIPNPPQPNPFGLAAGRPPIGARVRVHYIGWLPDGTQFDSSRDRGAPFEFVLGANTVIKGWECAISSMTLDELALVRCRADYAYGAYGYRPLIQPNATIDFELELVGWEDYDTGVQDVEGSNPFDDDDDEFDEITIDLDEFDPYARTLPKSAREDGPARGGGRTADGQAFEWEETADVVTLFVRLPDELGSRDVTCKVTPSAISLEVPAAGIALNAPLKGRVFSADAYWLIDKDAAGNRCVQVFMDKEDTYRWEGVLDEGTTALPGDSDGA